MRNKKKEIIIDPNDTKGNEKDLNSYSTEKDYQDKQQEQKNKEIEVFTEETPKEKEQRRNNSEAVQVAAEIVLEVFIHAVFIVATLWN